MEEGENNKYKKAIRKALPAVVSITFSKELKLGDNINPLAKLKRKKGKKIKIGGGSGFLVSNDGIVLTNRHVVKNNDDYTVILQDGRKFKPKILARDYINDIAILKIGPGHSFPFIELGNSSKVELGEEVIAIGNALGVFQNTVSAGIVSGLFRTVIAQDIWLAKVEEKKLNGLIQTDAAINPGNSGGPLTLLNGKAIGINAIVVSGAENIGFAVPINRVKKDLEDIKKYGRIRKPYIGIRYIPIDNLLKEKLNLPVNYGVLVIGEPITEKHFKEAVIKNSPADKAGIREKDIILEIDGKKVTFEKTIPEILQGEDIGKKIEVKLIRNKKIKVVNLTLKEK